MGKMYGWYNLTRGLNFKKLIAGDFPDSHDETRIPLPWITSLDDFIIANQLIIFELEGGMLDMAHHMKFSWFSNYEMFLVPRNVPGSQTMVDIICSSAE